MDTPNPLVGLSQVLGVLMLVTGAGYYTRASNILPATATGAISGMVGKFCLPPLVFRSMFNIDLSGVNPAIMIAVALGKLSVFAVSAAFVMLTSRKSKAVRLGKIGVFGNFVTNSNDFAFGVPIVNAVFPELMPLLFLLAAVQGLIMNPLSFVCLELGKAAGDEAKALAKAAKKNAAAASGDAAEAGSADAGDGDDEPEFKPLSCGALVIKVIKSLAFNPYVAAIFTGLISGIIFNHNLPAFVDQLCTTMGNAFTFCALYSLGMGIYGKAGGLRGRGILQPGFLVLLKTVLLPILIKTYLKALEPISTGGVVSDNLIGFAYVYGSIPTSASVALWARQYSVYPDRMSASTLLCMLAAGPLLFMATVLLQTQGRDLSTIVDWTLTFFSELTCWTAVLFLLSMLALPRFRRMRGAFPLDLYFYYVISLLGEAIFELLCHSALETNADTHLTYHAKLIFRTAGVLWLCAIAWVTVQTARHGRAAGPMLQSKRWLLHVVCWVVPSVFSAIVAAAATEDHAMMVGTMGMSYGCYERYSQSQVLPDVILQFFSIAVMVASLVAAERAAAAADPGVPHDWVELLNDDGTATSADNPMTAGADKGTAGGSGGVGFVTLADASVSLSDDDADSGGGDGDSDGRRDARHSSAASTMSAMSELDDSAVPQSRTSDFSIAKMILLFSLFGAILEVTLLSAVSGGGSVTSGIILEVRFLAVTLVGLRASFVWLVLGTQHPWLVGMYHAAYKAVVSRYRRAVYGAQDLKMRFAFVAEDGSTNTAELMKLLAAIAAPESRLIKDRRYRLRKYKQVLVGRKLVSWLVNTRKAPDREAALEIGRALDRAHLIAHVSNEHEFDDAVLFYRLTPAGVSSVQAIASARDHGMGSAGGGGGGGRGGRADGAATRARGGAARASGRGSAGGAPASASSSGSGGGGVADERHTEMSRMSSWR